MRTRILFLAMLLAVLPTTALAARQGNVIVKRPAMRQALLGLMTTDMTQGVTPGSMVSSLLGPGITASNVTYNGAQVASGDFQGGTGIIGFESGIILSSGCISNVIGPNVSDSISCDNNLAGDADLDALSGFGTYDATVLEFDFVPTDPAGTTLLFSYVFASDEYNEFAYTPYNDVFAFYVNGQDCALVPGPGPVPDPVTINTVNGGNPYASGNERNPLLYRNNDLDDGGGFIDSEMDGLTVVLTCQAAITPNATNHIKLAIADASDHIYDSMVMIRAGSLTPTDLNISLFPPAAVNLVGTTHTVAATVVSNAGAPQDGVEIRFAVISGPNAGAAGVCSANADCTTDADGHVSFTYAGGATPGTDIIRACFDDNGGNENCSLGVTKQWVVPCGPDGTACGTVPGDCEYQDTCLNDFCHHNGFKPPTTECRPVAGVCDLPEFCSGTDPVCPLDQHQPDGTTCDDGNPCTAGDACGAGLCAGATVPLPPEVDAGLLVTMSAGVAVVSWNPASNSTAYDVLRGLVSALPVGPGGGDEACLASSLPSTNLSFRDGTDPATGAGFWYVVRGVNLCGHGPYGFQAANGLPSSPRDSTTCP